jgi:hypothetical protein
MDVAPFGLDQKNKLLQRSQTEKAQAFCAWQMFFGQTSITAQREKAVRSKPLTRDIACKAFILAPQSKTLLNPRLQAFRLRLKQPQGANGQGIPLFM